MFPLEVDHVPSYYPGNGHIKRIENKFIEIFIEDATPFIDRPRIVSPVCAGEDKRKGKGSG